MDLKWKKSAIEFVGKESFPQKSKPLKYHLTHNIYCTIFPNLTQCALLYHMVKRRKKASLRPLKARAELQGHIFFVSAQAILFLTLNSCHDHLIFV